MRSSPRSSPNKEAGETAYDTPLQELSARLDCIEKCLSQARHKYREAIVNPPVEPPTTPRLSRFGFGRRKKLEEPPQSAEKDTVSTSPIPSPPRSANRSSEPQAKFIDISEQEEVIENLRRVAELVVIGENYVTTHQKRQATEWQRAKEKWTAKRDDLDLLDTSLNSEEDDSEESRIKDEAYMNLFDLFFERNALEMIVNMLTGATFDFSEEILAASKEPEVSDHTQTSNGEEVSASMPCKEEEEEETEETKAAKLAARRLAQAAQDDGRLLPTLPIATQAVQSMAILIQNVSRATSLYVLLSNDHINKLIRLPTDLYATAERRRQKALNKETKLQTFASPELAELTTHFITFLKSLAMRMNAETLQFFLKYPTEQTDHAIPISDSHFSSHSSSLDEDQGDLPSLSASEHEPWVESTDSLKVDFPLYERTLEFCAAHQDSFVRVTAMNICLNTLRLATVSPLEEAETEPGAISPSGGSSPDGVLHNAKPLPFREQLAIALHTCHPSRVERLIAPIFTKLAERWNALDEQIRLMDSNRGMHQIAEGGARNEKVALAKEKVRRERLKRTFKDKAADLQDELLLLEDVFKVGLTVLNEQMIEMMFATFVYPLLLQPLLQYSQRLAPLLENAANAHMFSDDHPLGEFSFGDFSDAERALSPVAGPAKTALFTLASVFQFLTNPPLLRLLFTALFHPLCPDTTKAPTVRGSLDEAIVRKSQRALRLDKTDSWTSPVHSSRSTYEFGTDGKNRRLSSKGFAIGKRRDEDSCIFVLCPALAEVLEFDGKDVALITRTRPNPYRQAILQFLQTSREISDVQELCVCTIDTAVSTFDSKFVGDVLFGTDLKSFADDMPVDERNLDSSNAHTEDDRGMGGAAVYESRHALNRQKGGTVGSNLTGEVVNALVASILFASKDTMGAWKLAFDEVAAHALLYSIRRSGRAMTNASKSVEQRWRKAASFIASRPTSIHSPMGGSSLVLPGSPTVNAPDYEEQMFGGIMNLIFFDNTDNPDAAPVVEDFLQLKVSAVDGIMKGCSLPVSSCIDFDRMCDRVASFLFSDLEPRSSTSFEFSELQLSRTSARSLLKLDALLALLSEMAAIGGGVIADTTDLGGIAITPQGSLVDTKQLVVPELSRQLVCPISTGMLDALFADIGEEIESESAMPVSGAVISLVGSPAIPCVCDTPASAAHLFATDGSSVVAEGVTWQSLYLVFLRGYFIFAQPVQNDGATEGEGRVIVACPLERLEVEHDSAPPAENGPRRLLLSHKWFDKTPPGLFLFETLPEHKEYGPFVRVHSFTSSLDVWFEDQNAAEHAFQIMSAQIFTAKSYRGQRVQRFFAPEEDTPKTFGR